MILKLDPDLKKRLPREKPFDYLMHVTGEVKRHVQDRETLAVVLNGKSYFIKRYRGCGWCEIFKESLQGKRPVLGAAREWHILNQLSDSGIKVPRPVGFGSRGCNPAKRESFLVTEALFGMLTLEDLAINWGGLAGKKQKELKCCLIKELAKISRVLHRRGINHRDYYLCHFLVHDRDWLAWRPVDALDIYLIDLHRAQARHRVPERWLVKDLGGLLFSALDIDLTHRDLYTFALHYRKTLKGSLRDDIRFWKKVLKRAVKLYRQIHGKAPRLPASLASFA